MVLHLEVWSFRGDWMQWNHVGRSSVLAWNNFPAYQRRPMPPSLSKFTPCWSCRSHEKLFYRYTVDSEVSIDSDSLSVGSFIWGEAPIQTNEESGKFYEKKHQYKCLKKTGKFYENERRYKWKKVGNFMRTSIDINAWRKWEILWERTLIQIREESGKFYEDKRRYKFTEKVGTLDEDKRW